MTLENREQKFYRKFRWQPTNGMDLDTSHKPHSLQHHAHHFNVKTPILQTCHKPTSLQHGKTHAQQNLLHHCKPLGSECLNVLTYFWCITHAGLNSRLQICSWVHCLPSFNAHQQLEKITGAQSEMKMSLPDVIWSSATLVFYYPVAEQGLITAQNRYKPSVKEFMRTPTPETNLQGSQVGS